MAFCDKCGAQLEGGERFCKSCGHDLSAAGAAPAAPPTAAAPVAFPSAPPGASYPQYYSAPAPIPVATTPARRKMPTPIRVLVFLVGIVAIWSGLRSLGIVTWPTKMVGQLQPPAGVANAALVQRQVFSSPWNVTNGDVQLSRTRNGITVRMSPYNRSIWSATNMTGTILTLRKSTSRWQARMAQHFQPKILKNSIASI